MSVTTSVKLKKVVLNFWNLYSIFIIVLYSFPVFFYFFLFVKKIISLEAVTKACSNKIVSK